MTTPDPRAPLPVTRRAQLLEALQREGTVRVSDLVETLGVAAVTIRRDIAQLAEEGLIRRVHGGATLLESETSAGAGIQPGDRPATTPRQLGMLVPSLDYYWPEVVRGAEEAARREGLRVVLRGSSYETEDDRPQLRHLVERVGVDGLVIAPRLDVETAAATLEWAMSTGRPVVLVERHANVGQHHEVIESVETDHALGAAMAVHHLVSIGHKRVGLLATEHSPHSPSIRRGWAEAAAECGISPGSTLDISVAPPNVQPWEDVMDTVLDEAARTATTALVVHADAEAIALVQRAEARSIRVPADLSVVAYDDEVAGLFSPPLTAVRPPRRSIGRAAIDLMAARLADPGRPSHRVIISPSLCIRSSTAAPVRSADDRDLPRPAFVGHAVGIARLADREPVRHDDLGVEIPGDQPPQQVGHVPGRRHP